MFGWFDLVIIKKYFDNESVRSDLKEILNTERETEEILIGTYFSNIIKIFIILSCS